MPTLPLTRSKHLLPFAAVLRQHGEPVERMLRTMQRRLSTEKTTYSGVIESTRAAMAGELLEGTDATMAEVARELGYKHQGDFTRAFRRWSGVSPSEFRRWRN